MANIISLSKYQKMFPHKVTKSGNPKIGTPSNQCPKHGYHTMTPPNPYLVNSSLKSIIRLRPSPYPPTSTSSGIKPVYAYSYPMQPQTDWESSCLKYPVKPLQPLFMPLPCCMKISWQRRLHSRHHWKLPSQRSFPAKWLSDP